MPASLEQTDEIYNNSAVQEGSLGPVEPLARGLLGQYWTSLPARYKIVFATSLSFVICNMVSGKNHLFSLWQIMLLQFGFEAEAMGVIEIPLLAMINNKAVVYTSLCVLCTSLPKRLLHTFVRWLGL